MKKNKRVITENSIFTIANVITISRCILLIPLFTMIVIAIQNNNEVWFKMRGFLEQGYEYGFVDNTYFIMQILGAVFFLVIAGLDLLDGYVARKRNEITNFGKIVDPLVDKIQVWSALIILNILSSLPIWITLIIIIRDIIVTTMRIVVKSKHGEVNAADILGKYKTFSQCIALAFFLLPLNFIPEFFFYAAWALVIVALILTVVSGISYIIKYTAQLLD